MTGTSGNDTVLGTFYTDSASSSSFQSSDSINLGAGSDTLSITVQNLAGSNTGNVSLPAATLAGVETLNVRSLSTTAADVTTVAAANYTGVTAVNADRAINATAVTGLAAGASAGMIGNGAVLNGALNVAYAAATSPVTLNISGGTLNTGNAAKIAVTTGSAISATVNSTGAANAVDTIALSSANTVTALTINAATNLTTGVISGFKAATTSVTPTNTLTITGAATVVAIGALDASIGTVDASGLTAGGVTTLLNATPTTFTFKGGAGQDIISTAAAYTTLNAVSIDAGAGTTDRLIVTASTHADAPSALKYANFEQIQVNAGVNVDVSLFTNSAINAVRIADGAGAAGVTNLTAAQAAAVTVISAGASAGALNAASSAITIDIKNASTGGQLDTVTAALSTSNVTNTTAANIDLSGLTLTGIETLNLVGSGTSTVTTGAVFLTTQNAIALSSITLNNAGNGNIISVVSTQSTNLSIDASASAGSTTIEASAYNSTTGATLKGGAGADVIYGSAKADTILGGAGNDAIRGDGATFTAEVQTVTVASNAAAAVGSIVIGGVATATAASDSAATQAAAVVTNKIAIIAGNTSIADIAQGTGPNAADIIITYKTIAGNVAPISTSATGGANGGAAATPANVETTAGAIVTVAHTVSDTLTGGAGNDTFYFAAGGAVTVASFITDLNLGTAVVGGQVDVLNLKVATPATAVSVVALTAAQQTAVSAAADLATAVNLVLGNSAIATNNVSQFTFGTDTYVVLNGDGATTAAYTATNDILIKITGVAGTLDNTDIVLV